MARYTMELSQIVNSFTYGDWSLNTDKRIAKALPFIFDFDYPIFDENYRLTLETRFIQHFYFREIGQETYARWKFQLQEYMQRRMPYWNKMFKTLPFEDIDNPTWNTDVYEEYTKKTENSATSKANAEATSKSTGVTDGTANHIKEDTPMGRLSASDNYASEIDTDTNKVNTTGTGTQTSTDSSQADSDGLETYDYHRYGNIGVQTLAEVLQGTRKAYITVEDLMFQEMDELFMQLY